ncbi:hypothetical protein D3C81_2026540 [compost metagenome]
MVLHVFKDLNGIFIVVIRIDHNMQMVFVSIFLNLLIDQVNSLVFGNLNGWLLSNIKVAAV